MRIRDWSSDVCSSDLVRTAFDLGLERSAQRGVDGVAHAGRAVVGEVVVAVARVLRLCVLGQRRCQARGFGVAEVEPLDRHAATNVSVVGQVVGERQRLQSIAHVAVDEVGNRSEEHTSELQSLMRISYAVFCLKKKKKK